MTWVSPISSLPNRRDWFCTLGTHYWSDFLELSKGSQGTDINDTCLSHIRCHCAHLSTAKPFLSPRVFHAHLYLTPPPSLLLIYHFSRNQPLTTARELLSQCRKVVSESWCFFLGGNNGLLFVFREEQANSQLFHHTVIAESPEGIVKILIFFTAKFLESGTGPGIE